MIPYSQLHFLIKNQLTTPQIVEIMGTSVQIIQKIQMSEYIWAINQRPVLVILYTCSDQQLDDLVMSINSSFQCVEISKWEGI